MPFDDNSGKWYPGNSAEATRLRRLEYEAEARIREATARAAWESVRGRDRDLASLKAEFVQVGRALADVIEERDQLAAENVSLKADLQNVTTAAELLWETVASMSTPRKVATAVDLLRETVDACPTPVRNVRLGPRNLGEMCVLSMLPYGTEIDRSSPQFDMHQQFGLKREG